MTEKNNRPIKTFRVGNIKAAIWENRGDSDRTYHSVALTRSYKEGEEWRESSVFGRDDLPRVELATRSAFEFIHLSTDKSQNTGFAEKVSQEESGKTR